MFASPRRTRFGISSGRDSAICPSVFLLTSPYSAASGSSPIPTLSSTIQKILSNSCITPLLKRLSPALYHTVCPGNPPRQFRSYAKAGLRSWHSEFLSASCLLYSGTSRSLNYLPFACVVQDSGGVPWPRTAIPGEFPSSSRSSSLRSAPCFSSAIGIPVSIPCLFSGPTGRSFSSSSASERYGITCKEAAIPTHLREFPSRPPLPPSHFPCCG